jgi:hypothetical protein
MADKKLQKISEYLIDCGTHEIFDAFTISQDFIKCTGINNVPWIGLEQNAEWFGKAIDARGIGGKKPTGKGPLVDCTAMAEACYRVYGGDLPYADKMGRGSHIRELIGAIIKNGN